MTFEEAKKIFLNRGYIEVPGGTYYDADKWRNAVAIISKWLEQQSCDDCISREAVLDALHVEGIPTKRFDYVIAVQRDIIALPPVTPKEKAGHWINNHTQCSKCEWGMEDDVVGSPMMLFFPFCPNCGAKMIETEESER